KCVAIIMFVHNSTHVRAAQIILEGDWIGRSDKKMSCAHFGDGELSVRNGWDKGDLLCHKRDAGACSDLLCHPVHRSPSRSTRHKKSPREAPFAWCHRAS